MKLSSPKIMKDIFVLTKDKSEKDRYINKFSDRLNEMNTLKENNGVVSIQI
jgi:hypothetical protein